MKTFKHAMGDEVTVNGVIGKIVGRCEYSEDYEPGVPRQHGNYYCVRMNDPVSGFYNWQWYPEAEVQETL